MADMNLIKQLREMTQAGFLDCKNALIKSNDNLEAAAKYLREKGIAKAAKKAGAIAAEGVILVRENDNNAIIVEINTQTDFAAKNENFVKLSEDIANSLLTSSYEDVDAAQHANISTNETVEAACSALTGKIGEKITLRRLARIYKKPEQDMVIYQHANKKYGAIVLFSAKLDEKIKKQVAMHVVARNPKFINSTQVDAAWLEQEKQIIESTSANGNKPLQFLKKIVDGRMHKRLAEVCLVDQEFDFEPGVTVGKILMGHGAKVLSFVRYEVGEGIEKKSQDFAAEVAEQMGNK